MTGVFFKKFFQCSNLMYSSSYSTHLSALSTLSQPKSYICVHIWAVPAAALSSWGDWWCLFWCLDLKRALHQTQCVHAEKKKKKNHMNNFHVYTTAEFGCLFVFSLYVHFKQTLSPHWWEKERSWILQPSCPPLDRSQTPVYHRRFLSFWWVAALESLLLLSWVAYG